MNVLYNDRTDFVRSSRTGDEQGGGEGEGGRSVENILCFVLGTEMEAIFPWVTRWHWWDEPDKGL